MLPAEALSDVTRIHDVLETVPQPMLIMAEGRVLAANRAARELLGQHILGEDIRLAIRHPAAAEQLRDPAPANPDVPVHLVGLGTRDQRWEMRIRDAGDWRVVHLTDRTESHAAERMRVNFVANASHELRTPLASILGYVETLREGAAEDPATAERFLKTVHDEAQRMQRLVDDLISLSRIEADQYSAPDMAVDLAALIDEVRRELTAGQSQRAADLVTELEALPAVRGDRAQLSQLLHNIVGNAMKYGRAGTPITIRAQPAGGMVRIAVSDHSEGIPATHIPRLTERFYRVDEGRSRVSGTGLGLAIVKHIVERHRGQLDIASTVGEGTTVTVLLPAKPAVIKW